MLTSRCGPCADASRVAAWARGRGLARWLVLAGLVVAAWAVSALCAQGDQAHAAVRPVAPPSSASDTTSSTAVNAVTDIASSEGESVGRTLGDLLGDQDQPLPRTTESVANTLRPASAYAHRLLRHVTDLVLTTPAASASRLSSGDVLAGPARLISTAQRLTGDAPSAVLSGRLLPRHPRQVTHWASHVSPRPTTAPQAAVAEPSAVPVTGTVLGPKISVRAGLTRHRRLGAHDVEVRHVRPHGHRQMPRREPAGPFGLPSHGQNQGLPAPSGLGGGFGPASVADQADWAVKPTATAASSATTRQPIVRTIAGDRSFSPD